MTRVVFRIDDDEQAAKIVALLSALGYDPIREVQPATPEGKLAAAIDRIAERCQLTDRERDVLDRKVAGDERNVIAAAIGISRGTVKWHMHNLMPHDSTAVAFAPEPNAEESGYYGDQFSAFSARTPRYPAWAGSFYRRVERLLSLERNWDTYGASPLSRAACEDAVLFMFEVWQRLPQLAQPDVFPEVDGGVRLEWERGDELLALYFEPGGVTMHLAWDDEDDEVSYGTDVEPIFAVLEQHLVK